MIQPKVLAGRRLLAFSFQRVTPPENGLHVGIWQRMESYQALGAEVHLVSPQAWLPRTSHWPPASQTATEERGVKLHLVPANAATLDFWWAAAWQLAVKKLGRVVWPRPDSLYYWRPQLMARWRRLVREGGFDLALVNYANWSRLLPPAKAAGAATILEMHELQVRQFVARHELAGRARPGDAQVERFRQAELRCLGQADLIISVNDEEGALIREQTGRRVLSLPNGLRTPDRSLQPEPAEFLVVGSYIAHNQQGLMDFLRGSWPRILAARPDARLTVCGGVGEALRGGERNVTWIKFAPDLTPHYLGAKVVLLTTVAGAGIKIKAVEAMAHGCCILSHAHSVNAFAAFQPGVHGEVVEDLAEAAEPALRLLGDPKRRAAYAAAAFQLFQERYSFEATLRALGEAVCQILPPRAGSAHPTVKSS